MIHESRTDFGVRFNASLERGVFYHEEPEDAWRAHAVAVGVDSFFGLLVLLYAPRLACLRGRDEGDSRLSDARD